MKVFFNQVFKKLLDPFRIRSVFWIMVTALVTGLGIFCFFMLIPPLTIWPSEKGYNFCFFSDTANQGHSEIISHTSQDGSICINYILRRGFVDPYVSIHIAPVNREFIDLSNYNQLVLDLEGLNSDNIGFDLLTSCSIGDNSSKAIEADFYANIIQLIPTRKKYILSFDELKVPDYWYVNNNLSPNLSIPPDLKRVSGFNIGTAYPTRTDVIQGLKIHAIRFERNNRLLVIYLLVCELLVYFSLLLIYYIRNNHSSQRQNITIAYQAVNCSMNLKDNLSGSYLDFINHHFQDPDLSLEKIARHFGVNQRQITKNIQNFTGSNFKSYLNQLRIHESKRLLKSSQWNISEVAFKTGFNTVSHFNRVFKAVVGVNPTEFKSSDIQ